MVVDDLGAVEGEPAVVAVQGHAAAVAVVGHDEGVLVHEVARHGHVAQRAGRPVAGQRYAARPVAVVAGAARDEPAREDVRAALVVAPEVVLGVAGGVLVGVGEGAGVLDGLVAAVDAQRGALAHPEDLAVALAVPLRAEGAGLLAVYHVAVQVEGVVAPLGHLQAGVLDEPVVGEADGHVAAHRLGARHEGRHVVEALDVALAPGEGAGVCQRRRRVGEQGRQGQGERGQGQPRPVVSCGACLRWGHGVPAFLGRAGVPGQV